ncbi:MAG: hypothetical protein ACPG52_07180, partial [Cognaticolwellia sp.]
MVKVIANTKWLFIKAFLGFPIMFFTLSLMHNTSVVAASSENVFNTIHPVSEWTDEPAGQSEEDWSEDWSEEWSEEKPASPWQLTGFFEA